MAAMLTGGGDRGQASSRPAGKCPVVPAPVKGARTLASSMAQAPPLTVTTPFRNPAPIGMKPDLASPLAWKALRPGARNHSHPMIRPPSPQVKATHRQENCREHYIGKRPGKARRTHR